MGKIKEENDKIPNYFNLYFKETVNLNDFNYKDLILIIHQENLKKNSSSLMIKNIINQY